MILVGSQRGGPRALAAHLTRVDENDHVEVHDLRGVMAESLSGAFEEMDAISRGTRCRQFMFSLSFNPPRDSDAGIEAFENAISRVESELGLEGQPRAVVFHEKNGRRHAHAVWSRIDADTMKAINLPFFKNRLRDLSRELFLDNGWELPSGLRSYGGKDPNNFTLAEWQQARRNGLDPREIRQDFREAWSSSDSLASFRNALEERGFLLAQGDRRGFVAVDMNGEIYSVARMLDAKTRDVAARLGKPDSLPTIEATRTTLRARTARQLRDFRGRDEKAKEAEIKPLKDKLDAMVRSHRTERQKLQTAQAQRQDREQRERAARFRKGFAGLIDRLTGKAASLRKANDVDAYKAFLRDRAQRETLSYEQIKERRVLQAPLEAMHARHRAVRMRFNRQVLDALNTNARGDASRGRERQRERPRERDRDRSQPRNRP